MHRRGGVVRITLFDKSLSQLALRLLSADSREVDRARVCTPGLFVFDKKLHFRYSRIT